MTPTQARLIELARRMAAANPEAAAELAKHLGYYAGAALRPHFAQGAGIVIVPNRVTGRLDVRSSEEPPTD